MSVDSVNADLGPLMMTKAFAAEASREVTRVAASQGTQQLLARSTTSDTPPAVERKAMEQAGERNALTTYEYDPVKRSVGASTPTGDRVGMLVNTVA